MKKNRYLRLFIIIAVTVLLTVLLCNLYKSYQNNKLNKGYISKYVSTIKYEELDSSLAELGDKYYIYFGYTGNEDVYKLEKDIKRVVFNNHLEDNFLYVNVDNDQDVNNKILNVNEMLKINMIKKLPAIVYLNKNEVVSVIDSSNHFLNVSDFNNLLDIYEVKENE